MSQSSADQPIIPLDLKIETEKGREELRRIIKRELGGCNLNQVVSFSVRMALRVAWDLEKKKVRNSSKLDRFYFYWLRRLTLAVAINLSKNRKGEVFITAADDADAAYAAAYAF